MQHRLLGSDHQRVAGVVAALEAHHALRAVGQPVDDLALALVAPLGADDDDVARAHCHALLPAGGFVLAKTNPPLRLRLMTPLTGGRPRNVTIVLISPRPRPISNPWENLSPDKHPRKP